MDGMFFGVAALFRDLFSDQPPAEVSTDTPQITEVVTFSTTTTTESWNETEYIIIEEVEEDDIMHHTTATALVVTALVVLTAVALIALCFLLRKYCRCAYALQYTLNYGKVPKGAVLVPTEDQMENGDISKRSTLNVADSGVGGSQPSSRPQSPNQQRPPRPPPASGRSSLSSRQTAEQRPLLEKGADEPKSLSVQPSGLYPAVDSDSHHPDGREAAAE